MKTGTNDSIGPGLNPSSSSPRPSWKTRTSSPNAAAVDSRFSRIALIGMTIERKATSSKQEREAEHEGDDLRHAVRIELDDVERERGLAGDEGLDAVEAAEDLGHDLSAHLADDLAVPLVVLAAGHHVRHERDGAVG